MVHFIFPNFFDNIYSQTNRYTDHEIVANIDKLSMHDVKRVLARMLSTNPVLVLSGTESQLKKCASAEELKKFIRNRLRPAVL